MAHTILENICVHNEQKLILDSQKFEKIASSHQQDFALTLF